MKNVKIIMLIFGLLGFLAACEKEDPDYSKDDGLEVNLNDLPIYSLNSKDSKGFSAENLKVVDFPKVKPDFIIIPQTNTTGDVMSPFLLHPNLEKRFILSEEFDDPESALAYFETFNEMPVGIALQQFANNLSANQVWLIKTISGEFCKILVLEIIIDKKTSLAGIKFKAEKIQ
jgi:hypothetical protein